MTALAMEARREVMMTMEARREVMMTAEALMAAHPGAVVEPVELRGDRVGLCAHLPGAWRLGDLAEVRAWLEAQAPALATA